MSNEYLLSSHSGGWISFNNYGLYLGETVLSAFTMRFQFTDSTYDPRESGRVHPISGVDSGWKAGSTWTQVSTTPNIWDYSRNDTDWTDEFRDAFWDDNNLVYVLGANINGVTNLTRLFVDCYSIIHINLFDTSTVTNFSSTFHTLRRITEIPLFNTSNGVAMDYFMDGCWEVTQLPLFDLSNATDLYNAFTELKKITACPAFDTSSATDMGNFLAGCTSLVSVPVLDTSHAVSMGAFFSGCSSLVNPPLLDTSSSTTFTSFFGGTAITTPPAINTSNGVYFDYMFHECYSLTSMPVNYDFSKALKMNYTFCNCRNVGAGAYSIYMGILSSAATIPEHTDTFKNCGVNTTGGTHDLHRIPSSWGGTGT